MSDNPKPTKPKKKNTVKKERKLEQQPQAPAPAVKQTPPDYPPEQSALPIPPSPEDKKVIGGVEKIMEMSFLAYLKELKSADKKQDAEAISHLNGIISEFLGPYMLIGYLPHDNEPVEILYAPTAKDKEAILERLRKTFISHMNANAPS